MALDQFAMEARADQFRSAYGRVKAEIAKALPAVLLGNFPVSSRYYF